jgi:hypothetical protein
LKIDVKNAFNSVERDSLLLMVNNSSPSYLIYNGSLIYSQVGCQQGDPLGPAIFSLSIHPTIERLSSHLNVWYLDDGALGGSVETVNKKFNEILDSSDHRNKARLLAVSELESGAWLKALPSPNLGTLLDRQTLQIAVALRIGSEICHPHICICGSQVDKWGHHGLSCLKSTGRIPRHSALNDILKRTFSSVNIPCMCY